MITVYRQHVIKILVTVFQKIIFVQMEKGNIMDKLFIVNAKCVNQNSSIIEIAKDDLKIYLGDLMNYSLENKPVREQIQDEPCLL